MESMLVHAPDRDDFPIQPGTREGTLFHWRDQTKLPFLHVAIFTGDTCSLISSSQQNRFDSILTRVIKISQNKYMIFLGGCCVQNLHQKPIINSSPYLSEDHCATVFHTGFQHGTFQCDPSVLGTHVVYDAGCVVGRSNKQCPIQPGGFCGLLWAMRLP